MTLTHNVNNGEGKAQKTCFIIMPIADTAGYDSGHFSRVYEHLIMPACKRSGFEPIRADNVTSSNFIVLDILKKIVDCDLAICDLSSRNPNVMYELGLRQAFNKKTVIIKDNKTISPFDVQGFRYYEYDSTLRIDSIINGIESISNSITSTYEATDDVNSIVQLLKIEPAIIGERTKLSIEETVLFEAITEISKKVDEMSSGTNFHSEALARREIDAMNFSQIISLNNGDKIAIGRYFDKPNGDGVGFYKGSEREGKKFVYVFEEFDGTVNKLTFGEALKLTQGPPF
ncbi:hypothetical protein A8A01_15430 [Ewingella americana]|nr:hypothetical protein A8A01_15430 [Ewingella americana]